MPSAIEALLFDFGGVFTPSPFSVLRAAAGELGIDQDTAFELCFGPYADDGDHPWHRLERGEVRLEVAHEELVALSKAAGVDLDAFQVLAEVGRHDDSRNMVVTRVRQLRNAGYRTALVTNNIAEFGEGWRQLVPVDELFEVVVDSSQVGLRKPDPRIFLLALERLGGIPPDRAVLLDDFHAHVAVARGLGMHAISVGDDRAAALAELDGLLDGAPPR